MNIKSEDKGNVVLQQNSNNINYLRNFNIFYQYLCSEKQILILDAYARIKRSKNELEKAFNKL